MKTDRFQRKPFFVDAVRVTEENINEVAQWCQGEVRTGGTKGAERYIKVRVHRPLNDRQTQAFVGDWVLYAGTGYKVYMDHAFHNSFEGVQQHQVRNEDLYQRNLEAFKEFAEKPLFTEPEPMDSETARRKMREFAADVLNPHVDN